MLLAGRLLPLPMVIIFVPLAVALCYFAMRRLPASWPRFGAPVRLAGVPGGALLAMVVDRGRVRRYGRRSSASEQVFVASDPGVYLQYGYWIAGHGTARIPESAAAFGGAGGTGLRDHRVHRVGRHDHARVPAGAAAGARRRDVARRARRRRC